MRANRPESIICEQQAKFVQERVLDVESSFADLCSAFSCFSRKAARLRDASDAIAKVILSYSEAEHINKSLKSGLCEIAKTLNVIGDFRDLAVQRLENKVVDAFSQYEGICRRAKEELKVVLNAREKEMGHQRQLDRLLEKTPHNRQQIAKVEAELTRARNEISQNQKALEEQVDMFEKKKLNDIKVILQDFIKIQLALHAKAVELYTCAYNNVREIDVEQDLEELKTALANEHARLDVVKRTSFRSTSLQSIANIFSTPHRSLRRDSGGFPSKGTAVDQGIMPSSTEQPTDSRIISLRDEAEDHMPSPFAASSLQKSNF